MIPIRLWMFYFLGIQCAEDKNYKTIKAEYDKLKDIETMSPSKKYHDKIALFPDITWDNDIVKISMTIISTKKNELNTINIGDNTTTLREKMKAEIIKLVTTYDADEEKSKKKIAYFYNNDNTTEEEFDAAIEQLEMVAKEKEQKDDHKKCLLFEKVRKETIKMGKKCKLSAKEKQKTLINQLLQFPYTTSIFTGKDNIDVCTYTYVVFTVGGKLTKSEIIKATKKNGEEQIIHDLEEYVVKITKKKTTEVTTKPEVKTKPEKEEEASRKNIILLVVMLIIEGIVIAAMIAAILMKRHKKKIA